jgi:hypothetical protein
MIRHSTLLTPNHTEANARKIAELFKHTWTMTMRYFNNDIDDSDKEN